MPERFSSKFALRDTLTPCDCHVEVLMLRPFSEDTYLAIFKAKIIC